VIIDLPRVDPVQAALGRRLRRVRQARGFTVPELAAMAGLSPLRLGLGEQGRTRFTSAELHALIGALHISLGLLYGDSDLSGLRRL
jgi:transcriptional regulator with XRE-family HTH domain